VTQWKKEVKNDKMNLSSLKQSRTQDGLSDAELIGSTSDVAKAQDELNDNAEKTFKESVNQTLSFKEMQKIASDDVTWKATSLGVAQSMNQGIANLFKWSLKQWGKEDEYNKKQAEILTAQQKTAQQELKKLGVGGAVSGGKGDSKDIANTMATELATLNDLKSQAKEADETLNQQMKDLTTLNSKADTKDNKAKKEKLTKDILANRDRKKQLDQQITDQDHIVKLLGDAGENNKKMLKIQTMIALGTEDGRKVASNELLEMMGQNDSLDDLSKESGMSITAIKEAITDSTGQIRKEWQGKFKPDDLNKLTKMGATTTALGEMTPMTPGGTTSAAPTPVSDVGTRGGMPDFGFKKMAEGGIVKRPTNILAGEAGPEAVIPLKGGGAGKNITINVSANEKDLAQKISNEVRAVMYRDQMTGQG